MRGLAGCWFSTKLVEIVGEWLGSLGAGVGGSLPVAQGVGVGGDGLLRWGRQRLAGVQRRTKRISSLRQLRCHPHEAQRIVLHRRPGPPPLTPQTRRDLSRHLQDLHCPIDVLARPVPREGRF